MCGVAGSGKTSYAQRLEARGVVRLSVDEEIWSTFGRYGLDYPPDLYEHHQAVAQARLDERLTTMLEAGHSDRPRLQPLAAVGP